MENPPEYSVEHSDSQKNYIEQNTESSFEATPFKYLAMPAWVYIAMQSS